MKKQPESSLPSTRKDVYFVRHGQAAGGPSGMDRDFYLTAEGRTQAERLGAHFKRLGLKPDRIYYSSLTRARQTAEILNSYLNAPAYERTDLIEHGSHAYLHNGTLEDAARKHPEKLDENLALRRAASGGWLSWEFSVGGENLGALHSRARNAWTGILQESASVRQIVIVAHGSFLSAMLSEILMTPLLGVWQFSFENAAYLRLNLIQRDERWLPVLCASLPEEEPV